MIRNLPLSEAVWAASIFVCMTSDCNCSAMIFFSAWKYPIRMHYEVRVHKNIISGDHIWMEEKCHVNLHDSFSVTKFDFTKKNQGKIVVNARSPLPVKGLIFDYNFLVWHNAPSVKMWRHSSKQQMTTAFPELEFQCVPWICENDVNDNSARFQKNANIP